MFLFNQISDTYRCSPRAHASRVVRTRALATYAVWNVLEGRHVRRSRTMHGYIHNDVPSALAGSSGFPMDGESLIVSTASEAAIEPGNVVQCGPCWRARSGRVDRRWSDARAGMRDPRLVTRARPGGFCRTIHMPILVWAIPVVLLGRSEICSLFGMTLMETK